MKFLLLLVLAGVAIAKDLPLITEVEHLDAYNYHERIGLPMSEEIRVYEEELFKNPDVSTVSRIVGGEMVSINEIPFQAALLINLEGFIGRSFCGASLISANRLTTAAHCWYDGRNQAWRFTVVLGSLYLYHGGTRIETTKVIVHELWNPNLIQYDIGIIHLPHDVIFSSSISPVALPSGDDLTNNFAGEIATASGYGRLGSNIAISVNQFLSKVDLPIITNDVCSNSYGIIIDSTICASGAGGRSTCNGDSGGPLVVYRGEERVLIGVVSFGSSWGCSWGFPVGFARITSFMDFIAENE